MVALIIPDGRPLFTLATSNSLDLLLEFEITITDFVEFEINRVSVECCIAKRISDFIRINSSLIKIQDTAIGQSLKQSALIYQRFLEDPIFSQYLIDIGIESAPVPNDISELLTISYLNRLIVNPPNPPLSVLVDEGFLLDSISVVSPNVHLLSVKDLH